MWPYPSCNTSSKPIHFREQESTALDSVQRRNCEPRKRTKSPRELASMFRSEAAGRRLRLLAGAVVIGLIFRQLQFSTPSICCGDYDGYYHIMWSRLLWEGFRSHHLRPTFIWLPLTTLN